MKVWNYIVLIVLLATLFEFAGIPVATSLLTYFGISSTGINLKTAGLYLAIFGVGGILIGLGTGIVVGFFTKSMGENYVVLPLITAGTTLFATIFAGIISQAFLYNSWIGILVTLVMAPLGVGFLIALIEFFRGLTDGRL